MRLVVGAVIGLVSDLLGGLMLWWLAPLTGLGFVDGMGYWNWFWVSLLFTTLVSLAINVHEVVEEL